jgi:hypothetical protein
MRWEWPRTARAEKVVRYTVTGLIAAVPAIWAVVTDNPKLGLVALAIVLVSILLGPVIERTWIR